MHFIEFDGFLYRQNHSSIWVSTVSVRNYSKKSSLAVSFLIVFEFLLLCSFPNLANAIGTPDFGMTISQTCSLSQTCFGPTQIGLTARFTISYLAFGGFGETVNETVSGVPVAAFTMGTFFLSGPTTEILSVGNLSPATAYQLTVTATAADGTSHSITTTLTTPTASSSDSNSNGVVGTVNGLISDFNMRITPATQSPRRDATSATYYITYNSIDSFTGPIEEKVLNLPPQYVSFYSANINPYGYGSALDLPSHGKCFAHTTCTDALTIFFTVGSGPTQSLTSGRTYSLIVVGAAERGFPSHSVTITLTVP